MISDSHCHAGKGDGLTGPWDTRAPLEQYLRRAARAGIKRADLFAAFHSDNAIANREVARIVARRTGRFYGFALINPRRDQGRVLKLARTTVEEYGFVGIKAHRHDARGMRGGANFFAAGVVRRHGRSVSMRVTGESGLGFGRNYGTEYSIGPVHKFPIDLHGHAPQEQ